MSILTMNIQQGRTLGSLNYFADGNNRCTDITISNCPNVTTLRTAFSSCRDLVNLTVDDVSMPVITDLDWAFADTDLLSANGLQFLLTKTMQLTTLVRTFAYTNADIPVIDTSNVTNINNAFQGFNGTVFPSGWDFSSVLSAEATWRYSYSMTSFPVINFPMCQNFYGTWDYCQSLTSFPTIDVSAGTNFDYAWRRTLGMLTFPTNLDKSCALDFTSAQSMRYAFSYTKVVNFPRMNLPSLNATDSIYRMFDYGDMIQHGGIESIGAVAKMDYVFYYCYDMTCVGDLPANRFWKYTFFQNSWLNSIKSIDTRGGTALNNSTMFTNCTRMQYPTRTGTNLAKDGGAYYNSGILCNENPPAS